MIKYSFVIPTFNRIFEVSRAIDSCIAFKNSSYDLIDIIVVDDNSTDGTYEHLLSKYDSEIENNVIKVIRNSKNYGVVKSRVIGAKLAKGFWLIPLDSDNEIFVENIPQINLFLDNNISSPCCMFLCVDQNNNPIGNLSLNYSFFTLKDLLNNTYPEMCGIYNRIKFIEIFNDQLLFKLRRFEHIGNLRLLREYGNFMVSHLIVRKYYTDSDDRLSGRKGVSKDADKLFLGNLVLFYEFYNFLTFKSKFRFFLKIIYYALISFKNIFNT